MSSALETVQDFETKIKSINVKDFGDFRRKANSYLIRLHEELKNPPASVTELLREIQRFVNFEPTWKTEQTRRQILTFTEKVKKAL